MFILFIYRFKLKCNFYLMIKHNNYGIKKELFLSLKKQMCLLKMNEK